MDWQVAYDAYPINVRKIWLNNCGVTPTGRPIAARMQQHFAQMCDIGPGGGELGPQVLLASIKQKLGRLISAQPHEIALIHNTAEGMTMVSLGLRLAEGDQILLLENEYPSNVYPWEVWGERGVELSSIPMSDTPEEFLEAFQACLTPRTKVVALSVVHWCTGMPLPISEIARICHERDILLIVDGSQGVGMVQIDFASIAPAVLCFSAWKWLLGPLGLAGLVIDPQTLAKLRMPFKGTESVAEPTSYLPYQTEMRTTIDRYAYSTANYNDWVYLDASLDFLCGLGLSSISGRILELTSVLWQGLARLGFRSAYRHGVKPQSGILSVSRPGVESGDLANRLSQRGIVARVRLDRLRLAPHVYLSPDQMERTVREIREVAGAC